MVETAKTTTLLLALYVLVGGSSLFCFSLAEQSSSSALRQGLEMDDEQP